MAITFSKPLIEKLRGCLPLALKLKNTQAYRLASALLWYAAGYGINEITKLLAVSAKTVFNWLLKFMSGGIRWVMGKHCQGRGRKEKLTKAQQKQLHDMIAEGPEAHGFSSEIWNSTMVAWLILLNFPVGYNLRKEHEIT